MASMEFRIEQILDKATNTGKSFTVIRNNGDGYFVWDRKLMAGINVGDKVRIEYSGDKFPKVLALAKIESAKVKQETVHESIPSTAEDSPEFSNYNKAHFRAIAINVVMECYGEAMSLSGLYKLADVVTEYISTGKHRTIDEYDEDKEPDEVAG